jgi:CO/xanthine dehydrogenase Mo-binding subunit
MAASRWCLIRRFPYRSGLGVTLDTQSNGQGHETSFAQIAADLRFCLSAMPMPR